jgi:DNA polymerase, archaea type
MMKGLLLDLDYYGEGGKGERPVIRLFFKGEDRSFVAIDDSFSPYFYVVPDGLAGASDEVFDGACDRVREEILSADFGEVGIVDVQREEKRLFGDAITVLRIVLNHPQDVPKIRGAVRNIEGVKAIYEHDIIFVRRYLIDRGLVPLSWMEIEGETTDDGIVRVDSIKPVEGKVPELAVLSFDIEVYNPKGAPREDTDEIVMMSLASNTGIRKVITWKKPESEMDFVEVLDDEKAVLERFADIVTGGDFDVLVGYNTDNFDFPYIKKRLDKLGIELPIGRDGSGILMRGRKNLFEAKIKGRVHIDMYPIVKKSVRLSSYVLENVVRDVLGIEKEKIPGDMLWKFWDEGGKNFERMIQYSMEDAEVTLGLLEKFLPRYFELTRIVKQPLHDISRMTTGQLVEWLLMREASRGGELIPNRVGGKEATRRRADSYMGGYVKEPRKGICEDLAVFDFRSLYPSVIVTHNIDPSTLIEGGACDENRAPGLEYCFSRERGGFIPAILENLIERRMEVKERLKAATGAKDAVDVKMLDVEQYALKILANSFYGYMGYPRARWYRKECAESVAAFARMYIKKVMSVAKEEFGFEVVYGDTDSLFIVVPKKERGKAKEFLKTVNESLPGTIELEYEGFYKRGIFVTKKRYALIDEEDKVTVKGLEFVRRDWAPIARRTQEEVLTRLLKGAPPKEAAKVVRDAIESIRDRDVSLEDITIYTQLTKSIDEYKNVGPHVVAAKRLLEHGREVTPGMVIGYVITRRIRGIGGIKGIKGISRRAMPVEFVKIEDYDPEYYIDNQILPANLRIMEAVGYSKGHLKEGIKQVSLSKWL